MNVLDFNSVWGSNPKVGDRVSCVNVFYATGMDLKEQKKWIRDCVFGRMDWDSSNKQYPALVLREVF